MKKVLWFLSILLACCLLAGCKNSGQKGGQSGQAAKEGNKGETEDSHVAMVKNGCPSNYPDSPYGQVFDNYFTNGNWGHFEAKNEKGEVVDIVEFTGDCEFENKGRKAQIQFTVDEDNNSFDATYLALDGEAQTMTKLQELLVAAYAKEGAAVSGQIGVPAKESTAAPASTASTAATTQAPAVVVVPVSPSAPATQSAPSVQASGDNYYILPYSSSYRLSRSDISHLTKSQLRLARNEIYARHGRMFSDDSLQNYFNSQAWYTPIYSPSEFKDSWLSDVESDNISFIKSYE